MKIAYRLVLLVAVVAAGVWLCTILFPGPEKIIRKRLLAVASEASFKPGQNLIVSAASVESFAGYFSTNAEVVVNVPELHGQHSLTGREEILQGAATAHSVIPGLTVEFPDVNVIVNSGQQSAIANVTMKVQVSGEKDFNVQEIKFTLKKIDGEWLITRVETVRTLS